MGLATALTAGLSPLTPFTISTFASLALPFFPFLPPLRRRALRSAASISLCLAFSSHGFSPLAIFASNP